MRGFIGVVLLLFCLGEGQDISLGEPRTSETSSLNYYPARPISQTVVVRHSTSYGGVVEESFVQLLLGILLVILGFPVNYYNEKREVHMEKIFDYADKIVKSDVPTDRVDFSYEANLVHMVGQTSTNTQLKDGVFGVTVQNCGKLRRKVEMYQWVESSQTETRDTSGGGREEITTYSYDKRWSSVYHDSCGYKEMGHDNPTMPFESADQQAQNVSLGAFSLTESLIRQMNNFQDLKEEELPQNVSTAGRNFRLIGKEFRTYEGSPDIGDMQVNFQKVECGPTTVLSVQHDDSFVPLSYDMVPQRGCFDFLKPLPQTLPLSSRPGQPLLGKGVEVSGLCSCIGALIETRECLDELREDSLSAGQVIALARGDQQFIHIIGRVCGFLLFLVGFYLQFKFVPTLFRVIPWVGTWIQSFGNFFAVIASVLMACAVQCLTLAYSWLVLKPMRAASLLCMAAMLIVVPTVIANHL